MKRLTHMKKIASLLFFAFSVSMAQADIIYTNLDPANPFSTSSGSFVSSGGTDYSLSFAFTVQNHNYLVDTISFGALLASGLNEIRATIYADNGGVPGAVLFSGSELDNVLAASGSDNTNDKDLVTEAVGESALLVVGNKYWLGLDGISADSTITWGYNGLSAPGSAATFDGTSWSSANRTQGAFEIDGTIAAPEPFSAGLLVSGLSALVFFRRKLNFRNQ
jgi:hypothetical protein